MVPPGTDSERTCIQSVYDQKLDSIIRPEETTSELGNPLFLGRTFEIGFVGSLDNRCSQQQLLGRRRCLSPNYMLWWPGMSTIRQCYTRQMTGHLPKPHLPSSLQRDPDNWYVTPECEIIRRLDTGKRALTQSRYILRYKTFSLATNGH